MRPRRLNWLWQARVGNPIAVAVILLASFILIIPQLTAAQSPTGYDVAPEFKTFYDRSGGVRIFGYAAGEAFEEDGHLVQYFERQRLERHAENAGTPYEVLLGHLGVSDADARDLWGIEPFAPLPADAQSDGSCIVFAETGHRLCAGFKDYWQSHGLEFGDGGVSFRESLALFGFPISEEYTEPETGLIVQYFERARFEYHAEFAGTENAVLLGRLGDAQWSKISFNRRGRWNPAPTPASAQASTPAPNIVSGTSQSWRLVFGDEFNGANLDRTKWMTHYPDGTPGTSDRGRDHWGANVLNYYVDDAFSLQNGVLRIRAERRSVEGFNYTSGVIASYPSFNASYGYFEIRARIPEGKGLWPAFWLLPQDNSWPPEIDVMEAIGSEPENIVMTNHFQKDGQHQWEQYWYNGTRFSAEFHTFGMEWSSTSLIWYIDGVERARMTTNIPNRPMYVIANLAVGGPWPGAPDDSTAFPNSYDIDYIRVYQR